MKVTLEEILTPTGSVEAYTIDEDKSPRKAFYAVQVDRSQEMAYLSTDYIIDGPAVKELADAIYEHKILNNGKG